MNRSGLLQTRNKKDVLYDHFKSETSIHGFWSIAAAKGRHTWNNNIAIVIKIYTWG